MDEQWRKAAKELRHAYQAYMDDNGRVSHRMHDAIVDLRRAELEAAGVRLAASAVERTRATVTPG